MSSQWLSYEETFLIMNFKKLASDVIAKALRKEYNEILEKAFELNLFGSPPSVNENVVEKITRKPRAEKLYNSKEGIYVYKPDHPCANARGYVLEHRVIMEEKLGRYLEKDELIYRKDGDKFNNSLDNIYIKKLNVIECVKKTTKTKKDSKSNNDETKMGFKKYEDFSFEKNAYIYLRNKEYSKEQIMRMLKLTESRYNTIRKSTSKYISAKVENSKTSEMTIFTLLRIKKKHDISLKKIALYYKLSGQDRKSLISKL